MHTAKYLTLKYHDYIVKSKSSKQSGHNLPKSIISSMNDKNKNDDVHTIALKIAAPSHITPLKMQSSRARDYAHLDNQFMEQFESYEQVLVTPKLSSTCKWQSI